MRFPREQISVALFSLLKTNLQASNPGMFTTFTRRVQIWSKVEPAKQPWLGLMHTGPSGLSEQAQAPQAFGLIKWLLHYDILCYFRADASPNPKVLAETVANGMLDAIDKALASKLPGDRQTLGGLVTDVEISGDIWCDFGYLDEQAVLRIPLVAVTGIP